jgi:zinc protease
MTAPFARAHALTATAARPRPLPTAPRAYAFPRFERRALTNGLQLVIAPVSKLPMATVLALVDAGAVADPPGQEGLALLTAHALAEGAGGRDGAALAEYAERLGTAIDASADWDAALVRLTVLTARLPDAIALLGDVLMAPELPEREVERLKAERLAELLQLRAEPRGLADETLDRVVYAPSARYAWPAGGTETSVPALFRSDVAAFYGRRYHPGAVTLVVAGDVDPAAVERLAETALGRWRGVPQGEIPAPDWAAAAGHQIHLVAKPGAPQSELRLGHVGLPRAHPDYFRVLVMNAILGGLFSSRINLNLREAHGYTYGARSTFDWRRWSGPFSIDTAVQREVTDAAVREILHEIDRMRDTEVPATELSLATSYLDGVFPIRYETTAAIATALANLVLYGLPPDYYDGYRAAVREITAGEVLAAARTHLHPERLQIVVVGDVPAVRASLERLAFGPITIHDPQGAPLA